MTTTVSSKGQIVLPAEIRQQDGVKPGQQFEVERIERGEYRLKRKTRRRNEGLVKLLLACPVKGWVAEAVSTCDCLKARFKPVPVEPGKTARLQFVYRSAVAGRFSVQVQL